MSSYRSPEESAAGNAAVSSGDGLRPQGEPHLSPAPASRGLEVVGALVALVVSAALFVLSDRIEVRGEPGGIDPRWWPRLLGLTGLALSCLVLVTSMVGRPAERSGIEAATRLGRFRFLLTFAATIGYLLAWPVAGFVPTSFGLLVALTAIFGGRGFRALLIFPAALTGFVFGVFHLVLRVPL